MTTRSFGFSALLVGWLALSAPARAEAPRIAELRVQKVEQTTYFQVRFERPSDLRLPPLWDRFNWWLPVRPELTRLPRLVAQDDTTRNVYLRVTFVEDARFPGRVQPNGNQRNVIDGTPRIDGLEFFGQVQGNQEVKLLLLYPTDAPPAGDKDKKESAIGRLLRQQGSWAEETVTLDLTKAKKVDVPAGAVRRAKAPAWPEADDLEGLWAASQAAAFAIHEAQTPDFAFYGFARDTTARKYNVPTVALQRGFEVSDPAVIDRRLYEITTGATAITESLALDRLRNPRPRNNEQRTVDVTKLRGIEIAEHPWVKMMAGQKPSDEPLARLVPHDNYYLHFKNIVRFLEAGDLFDQWGTTLSRALEVNSRDHQLKERIEQQLCLKSSKLTRLFGPSVVKSLALTGSDPYLREGSDFTIIFHLANKAIFQASVEPYLKEAKKNFGGRLRETKSEYLGVAIESYVTPQRQVSLHRAFFDEYVLYSNSPVGIRRVIDTAKGKGKSLAESLDFQYMRTVFRLEDPLEDGFLFVSDPFLRNLVGPALRIKERRRLEAITSLYMINNGALYTAWETGQLPNHHNQLLALTGLKADELFSPEGDAAFWDQEAKSAVSSFYNTIQFATPLIEIPIDKVTPTEQREYEDFRQQYLGLWRQFFDPIGIRIGLGKEEIRWETYILPLVQISQYNDLRRRTGDGTIKIDSRSFTDKTMAQLISHISPKARERQELGKILSAFSRDIPGLNWLGDWFMVRLDDSPIYGKIIERSIRRELDPRAGEDWQDEVRLFFQIPLTIGVEIRNPLIFAGVLAAAKKALTDALPGAVDWEPMKEPYKDITIVQIRPRPNGVLGQIVGKGKEEEFEPALYYALIDGAWYVSLREHCIREQIDHAVARRQGKLPPATHPADVNTAVYFSPQAAKNTTDFLRYYLEWETHRRALGNEHILYALYRSGVITPADNPEKIQDTAMRYLSFIPVSPDYSPYSFDSKTDEVVSKRHGTLRRPHLEPALEKSSPLGQVVEQFRTIRADLRFREDGVHTTVIVRKKN